MRRVDHVYNLSRVDSARYTASPQTSGANIPRFVCQDDMHLQDRALVNNTPVGGRGSEGEDSLRSGPTTHFPAMERLFVYFVAGSLKAECIARKFLPLSKYDWSAALPPSSKTARIASQSLLPSPGERSQQGGLQTKRGPVAPSPVSEMQG